MRKTRKTDIAAGLQFCVRVDGVVIFDRFPGNLVGIAPSPTIANIARQPSPVGPERGVALPLSILRRLPGNFQHDYAI